MTTIFSDDFEINHNFNSWTQVNADGSYAVNTNNPHSGSYSAQFVTGGVNGYADAKKTFTDTSVCYLRAYYKFVSGLPASDGDLLTLGGLGYNDYQHGAFVRIIRTNGQLYWGIDDWEGGIEQDTYETTASNPTTGQWYCIEIKRDVASGSMQLWIDGTQKVPVSRSISGNNNYTTVGPGWQSYSTPTSVYVDDVVVADSYIGTISSVSHLAYTTGGGQSVAAGSVSSVITVQMQDSNNYPITTGAIVTLSTTSGGHFYSDSAGNIQISYITIPAGQSSGSFYYKDTTAGNPTLTASVTGLTSAITTFTINQTGSGDQTVTGNLTVNGNETVLGNLTVQGSQCGVASAILNNNANQGQLNLKNGSIDTLITRWTNRLEICDPGEIRVTPSIAGTPALVINTSTGAVSTRGNNTLDDGSGNASWTGYHTFKNTSDYLVYHSDLGGYTTLYSEFTASSRNDEAHVFCTSVSPIDHSPTDKPLFFVDQSIFAENDIATFGSLTTLSDPQKLATGRGGGGALAMGHGWTDPTDMPIILLADAQSNFNTVWLKAAPPASMPALQAKYAKNWPGASLELGGLTGHGNIYWNSPAEQEWTDLGSIQFNKVDNQNNFQRGMQLKCTVSTLGVSGGQLYPLIQIMYLDPNLSPDPWTTTHEFRPNGDTKIFGTLLYHGSLLPFDYMDDFEALRSIKTIADQKGRTILDSKTIKFLQDDHGFFDLNACIGWELSIQRKFLQEIDSLKTEITNLKTALIKLKGRKD